ncbi:ABATE domain-containing protein [Sphingomonas psychrotolerans]|uniref:ABATE domain-containing protein n=1 Tax=Sphingomonas psychrotolerans TaxID=1327635 RepID=A0ABU3N0V4_9SPHN|nr:ABATE domain-containing protein [Sphingomonas psychrotolerans]MDT8758122.1 ABATE domain-containing protein [Sphingomonas psychrotolerans]
MVEHESSGAELRDGFHFRGGHPVLDLVATRTGRLKPTQRELLAAPGDVGRWLVAAGFMETAPPATSADLEHARALREAVHAIVDALLDGRDVRTEDVDQINALAREPAAVPQIGDDGRVRLEGSACALLATLAGEAARLLGGDRAARIRRCEADGCAMLFLDTSRSGERRWCSMKRCGNKAKVAEFRRRRQRPSDVTRS